jgi:hypothetical protein
MGIEIGSVGGLRYYVAFLLDGAQYKVFNPPTTFTLAPAPASQILQKGYFAATHKQYQS